MLEQYSESNLVKRDWDQLFPDGKTFRILFDGDVGELRLVCRYADDMTEIIDAFSADNPNAFFMKKHGLSVPPKLYVVNRFGYFPSGMFYEIARKIKLKYGSLAPLVIGRKTMQYVKDYLTPLKDFVMNGGLGEGGEDAFVPDNIAEDNGKNLDIREYQSQIIGRLLFRGYGRGLFEAPTGCHAKGTNILMMDGSIKAVEDVRVGDRLVGDDGTARTVLSLCRGTGKMYKIVPTNGVPFVVNEDHVLSLVRSDTVKQKMVLHEWYEKKYHRTYEPTKNGCVIDISVKDWLKETNTFKHLHKLYRSTNLLEFEGRTNSDEFLVSPYLMGLILGDGCIINGCAVTTVDSEIKDVVYEEAERMGMHIRESECQDGAVPSYHFVLNNGWDRKRNPLNAELRRLGLFGHKSGNKFVPNSYKYGSLETRRQVLAGLIDTDGYMSQQAKSFSITSKFETMINDIAFIARSLGIKTRVKKTTGVCHNTGAVGTYWNCSLCGKNVAVIPTRLPRKKISTEPTSTVDQIRTGFTVEYMGIGDYYGFILDGNHRYVMADDGFVTHNSGKSFIIANYIYTLQKRYNSNLKVLIFVPNVQLVEQFYQDLVSYGYKNNSITRICGNSKIMKEYSRDANIFVANRQYVSRHTDLLPPVLDLIVCDEAHTLGPENSSSEFIRNLHPKMVIGCSGTLPRNIYEKYSLIGLIGPVFYKEEVTKLQNEGFLSRLHITSLQIMDMEVEGNKNCLFHRNSNIRYDGESEDGIAYNDAFNAETTYIIENCKKLYTPVLRKTRDGTKGNVLLLFDRLDLGKALFERAKTVFAECGTDVVLRYVDGQTPVEEREKIRQECEAAKDKRIVLFGQVACLSTGINIKNLETLVMLSSSKAVARTIQGIGRTLRLFASKERANIVDVSFNFKYSHAHYLQRLKLYQEFYHKGQPDAVERARV